MCTRIRKGIINPNYPGFQSLAYTLNEELNFYYSSENPSDDEEDSCVSESDDNELQRQPRQQDLTEDDENGNTCDGSGLDAVEGIPVPPPTLSSPSNQHHTEALYSSPVRRPARLRQLSTGHDPCPASITGTTIVADEKLDDITGTYACTPPDIVLQHSYDPHRSIATIGSTNALSTASLEQSNARRPDLIPEQQQQLLELENKKNEQMKHDQDRSSTVDDPEDHTGDEDGVTGKTGTGTGTEPEHEADIEGNRTPPSPAVELAPTGTSSNSESCNSHFLRDVTLSPDDIMLEDDSRCYDSASDGTLSDGYDQDTDDDDDEGEFEYQPYGSRDAPESRCPSPPGNEALTPDSPGSEGSSPGEVQYHLVDDCSHQTVQITRSRREHSPAKRYPNMAQHYAVSTSAPVPVPGQSCHSMARDCEPFGNNNVDDFAQTAASQTCFKATHSWQSVGANYRSTIETATEKPCDGNASVRTGKQETVSGRNDDQPNAETQMYPIRQYQKVPKVNPFCRPEPQEIVACDFFTKQAKLQIEARMALCQAKDMAHMQMEIEKRSLELSPVTKVIHAAVEKAGLALAADKRRLSRYYLTRLNVAQLQTILIELQCHAEVLNEELVELLMERDELHISQDATLIDIEDLSRYLCAKEQTIIHAERQRKSYHWKKSCQQPTPHQARPVRSGEAMHTVSAYRYH
ncbi:uncharacterized protein LOC128273010 [Anopheles cruzii]|uniref:uncharacterized protein LOC128273010 n=1 Tax=Anopheles cruzii TaxID=68878 RepID=UPI0022EC91C1|nr:uncharacterized protein LOC128273010 [Anopheles cruzii]